MFSRIRDYLLGLAFAAVRALIPSALDRALKALNNVEELLVVAAEKAQAKLAAEDAHQSSLNDLIAASEARAVELVEELARASRIRERINNLLS